MTTPRDNRLVAAALAIVLATTALTGAAVPAGGAPLDGGDAGSQPLHSVSALQLPNDDTAAADDVSDDATDEAADELPPVRRGATF